MLCILSRRLMRRRRGIKLESTLERREFEPEVMSDSMRRTQYLNPTVGVYMARRNATHRLEAPGARIQFQRKTRSNLKWRYYPSHSPGFHGEVSTMGKGDSS